MCWAEGATKMPLSRIIKSNAASEEISSFNFNSISGSGGIKQPEPKESLVGFMPLGIFDTSEVGSKVGIAPRAESSEQPEAPPGRFVPDEDMQKIQEESYQRGLEDGKSLAERGLQHVFRSLRTAVEDLQLLREKVLRESEDHLLDLVMAVSRKVLLREVRQDRQIVVKVIQKAIADLLKTDDLVIRVNPDDHALITSSADSLLKNEISAARFQLKPDPAVMIGGCLVETGLGTVDARIEAQLEEIFRAMQEEQAVKSLPVDEE